MKTNRILKISNQVFSPYIVKKIKKMQKFESSSSETSADIDRTSMQNAIINFQEQSSHLDFYQNPSLWIQKRLSLQ